MTILVLSPRSVSLIAVSVGSILLSVLIASLFVNYNSPGLNLTINENFIRKEPSLDPIDGNQTKTLSKWQEISEDGQEMIKDVENAENNSVGFITEFGKNGSEIGSDGNSLAFDEIPPNLYVDEDKANNSVITESNGLVSDGKLIDDSRKNDSVSGNEVVISFNFSMPVAAPPPPPPSKINGNSKLRSCDLYHGKWIYDPTGPLYTNNTCPILTQSQNCQGNGRPDKNYENWRWKPNQCELPRFDGRKFLELMGGKTLAFVGDSLSRNQMESLLCILWQTEVPIRGGNRFMNKWHFKSTSTTIALIWSAWLVHKDPLPIPFSSPRAVKVLLDTPDEAFMNFLPNFDVVVLSSGHWFTNEPTYVVNGTIVRRQLRRTKRSRRKQNTDIIKSYGIAIQTIMNAIINLSNYSGLVIFRSYSPEHYQHGEWNTGGSCAGSDGPSSKSLRSSHATAMVMKQFVEVEGAAKRARNGSKLRFMDISEISGYRQDGHPGPYGSRGNGGRKGPQDCVHWCMPGPVDTWNEILFDILQREI